MSVKRHLFHLRDNVCVVHLSGGVQRHFVRDTFLIQLLRVHRQSLLFVLENLRILQRRLLEIKAAYASIAHILCLLRHVQLALQVFVIFVAKHARRFIVSELLQITAHTRDFKEIINAEARIGRVALFFHRGNDLLVEVGV